jgi:predicted Zn-ribbon and HTH transcriptional regulator
MARQTRGIGEVLLEGCRCRCGHEWLPRERGEKPRVCPKCKSPNWDRPYRDVEKRRVVA